MNLQNLLELGSNMNESDIHNAYVSCKEENLTLNDEIWRLVLYGCILHFGTQVNLSQPKENRLLAFLSKFSPRREWAVSILKNSGKRMSASMKNILTEWLNASGKLPCLIIHLRPHLSFTFVKRLYREMIQNFRGPFL